MYYRLWHRTDNDFKSKSKIRIRIYKKDTLNIGPGEDLLRENVFLEVDKLQILSKADISKYVVPFPKEGVFIGLDLVGYLKDDGKLLDTYKNLLYIRYSRTASIDRLTYERQFGEKWKLFQLDRDLNVNAMFGLTAIFDE